MLKIKRLIIEIQHFFFNFQSLVNFRKRICKMVVIKAVFVGDTSVGKTAIIKRITEGVFTDTIDPTVGGKHSAYTVNAPSGDVIFNIWDTAGQEEFQNLIPMYFQGASVIAIIFDVTSRPSFEAIERFQEVIQQRAPEDVQIVLIGNKVDLERVISYDEGVDKSHQVGSPFYFEISAKTGQGVKDMLETIAACDEIRKDPDYMNAEAKEDEEPGCQCHI